MNKTTHPTITDVNKDEKWVLIDAAGQILGKLAVVAADHVRGKHKAFFHPSVNCGDHVVVINAEKIVLTGSKETEKKYMSYSGYPGGLKETTPQRLRQEHPERIIELAVKGMIPNNRLRKLALEKLHVYAGAEHPHAPQNPQSLTLE